MNRHTFPENPHKRGKTHRQCPLISFFCLNIKHHVYTVFSLFVVFFFSCYLQISRLYIPDEFSIFDMLTKKPATPTWCRLVRVLVYTAEMKHFKVAN